MYCEDTAPYARLIMAAKVLYSAAADLDEDNDDVKATLLQEAEELMDYVTRCLGIQVE